MIENDVIAQPLAILAGGIEKAVDHRQSIGLLIGQTGADQFAGAAVHGGLAIFDHIAVHGRLLDHVGIIRVVHIVHPAIGMTGGEIIAQQLILLGRGPGAAGCDLQIFVPADQFALRRTGRKLIGQDAHGHTGAAVRTTGPIGDILATPKADPPQRVVEFIGVRAVEFGEHLPLGAPGKIGTRRGVGQEKAGEAYRCAHGK